MRRHLPILITFILLGVAYALTLQTIPNGSSHYFMIDVGETQIVLNTWGTLHATGYPLYVILGTLLTDLLTAFGVSAVTAPALISAFWGMLTSAFIYVLAVHLTGRRLLAAGMVLLFGLTRSVWVHHTIAEVYTFGLLLHVCLLVLALWKNPIRGRIYWMAVLGGLAVAHHRATAMMIPALLYAVWPVLKENPRQLPKLIIVSLMLGLLGFTQYAYLYLRAQAGAAWVYGEPGTLAGLWTQFIGTEASRFIGIPATWADFLKNLRMVNDVIVRDLSYPGLLVGVVGLGIAVRQSHTCRAGIAFALVGLGAYAFHVSYYRDVLSALILLVTLPLVFGWLFAADWLIGEARSASWRVALVALAAGSLALVLIGKNYEFVHRLTHDDSGLRTIDMLDAVPDGTTVMLAWGPHYFAANIGQILLDRLPNLMLVDHKADFSQIDGDIATPEYTLFTQSLAWWQDHLGWESISLEAIAPRVVVFRERPRIVEDAPPGISIRAVEVVCAPDLTLRVAWQTGEVPANDLSIFVHGLDANGALIAQGDQSAPIYGWKPFTMWQAGEVAQDFYPLMRLQAEGEIAIIRYGLYRVNADSGFENLLVEEVEVTDACSN